MNRAKTIALLFAAMCAAAAGCNVICDTEELKSSYSDSELDCEGGRLDPDNDLCWQHPSECCYDWQDAIDYCEGLDLAGHTDWTLPSRDDFIDLLGGCDSDVLGGSWGYCDPCDESDTCSGLFGSDSDWYWSSSVFADYSGPGLAWHVHFVYGRVYGYGKNVDSRVRCVRRGP